MVTTSYITYLRARIQSYLRLVPSRYLSVFWDEIRLGIRLRRAQGVIGREEGNIASLFFLLPSFLLPISFNYKRRDKRFHLPEKMGTYGRLLLSPHIVSGHRTLLQGLNAISCPPLTYLIVSTPTKT